MKNSRIKKVLCAGVAISFFGFFNFSWGWSEAGHRIIAAMAYQYLTPTAKSQVDYLTDLMFPSKTPDYRFLLASQWPDAIRGHGVTAFNQWHFIDLPYSTDKTFPQPVNHENVVWAIDQSMRVLSSRNTNRMEKAWFLNFLIHFVGDVHQPFHCITLYNSHFPQGDRGGNSFQIQSDIADNLHAFWDEGGGLFFDKQYFKFRQVKELSQQILQEYPQSHFENKINNVNFIQWANESYALAKNQGYQIELNSTPSQEYIQMTRELTKQQLALAAYRLAYVLNSIFR